MGAVKLVWVFAAVAVATGGADAAPEQQQKRRVEDDAAGDGTVDSFPLGDGFMGGAMEELERMQGGLDGGGFLSSFFRQPSGLMSHLGSLMGMSHGGQSMKLLPPSEVPCKVVVQLGSNMQPEDLSVVYKDGGITVSHTHEQSEEVTQRDGSGSSKVLRKTVSSQKSSLGFSVPKGCLATVGLIEGGFGGWVYGVEGGHGRCTVVLPGEKNVRRGIEQGLVDASLAGTLEASSGESEETTEPESLCEVQGFTKEECAGRVGKVGTVEPAVHLEGGGITVPRYDM